MQPKNYRNLEQIRWSSIGKKTNVKFDSLNGNSFIEWVQCLTKSLLDRTLNEAFWIKSSASPWSPLYSGVPFSKRIQFNLRNKEIIFNSNFYRLDIRRRKKCTWLAYQSPSMSPEIDSYATLIDSTIEMKCVLHIRRRLYNAELGSLYPLLTEQQTKLLSDRWTNHKYFKNTITWHIIHGVSGSWLHFHLYNFRINTWNENIEQQNHQTNHFYWWGNQKCTRHANQNHTTK